jgi:hypothetical protein
MELCSWIDSVDGCDNAASLLGEKPRTVYSWYRKEKAPRLKSAIKIIAVTKGAVDFNGIYIPLAREQFAQQKLAG